MDAFPLLCYHVNANLSGNFYCFQSTQQLALRYKGVFSLLSSGLSHDNTDQPIPGVPDDECFHDDQGYAWQSLRISFEHQLSQETLSKNTQSILAMLRLLGPVYIQSYPMESSFRILVCHTCYPALLHRVTSIWLHCVALLEELIADDEQHVEVFLGNETRSAEESLQNDQYQQSAYDWIYEYSVIPEDERNALRKQIETVFKKRCFRHLGVILLRDMRNSSSLSARCFSYIPIILEGFWYTYPDLPTSICLHGFDFSLMIRRPREALRVWIRALSTYLRSATAGDSFSPIARIQQSVYADCSLPYTLKSIGEEIGLSPAYLCRTFHAQTGESFSVFLTRVRMLHAKQLLTDSSLSIQEIARLCGYPSKSYFTLVFTNMEGVSPEAYMLRVREQSKAP